MIYGVGVDLVYITRMGRVIDKWGNRFIHRVFSTQEITFCFHSAKSVSRFALHFAAKEAFSKAIGLGMRKGIRWRDVEVFHHPSGRPDLTIAGAARSLCHKEGITRWHVSLSDDGDYGVAVVVLEKAGPENRVAEAQKGP